MFPLFFLGILSPCVGWVLDFGVVFLLVRFVCLGCCHLVEDQR